METPAFSPTASLSYGWDTFNRRPGILIASTLVVFVASFLVGFLDGAVSAVAELTLGELSIGAIVIGLLVSLLGFAASTLINIGNMAFSLKAHDDISTVSLSSLWQPQYFWNFLATYILLALSVVAGLLLFIVPGIIFLTMFLFSLYLVIDRNLGPLEAMKESRRITNGNRLAILGLIALLILINVLGLLAAIVGLLVTTPVSALAIVHAYRTLAAQPEPATPAAPTIPVA